MLLRRNAVLLPLFLQSLPEENHRWTQIRPTQSRAFPWRESVHRTVPQSEARPEFTFQHLCSSVSICVQVVKTIVNTGFLKGWTAIVSGNVSSGAIAKTIRHHWLELAETSPPLAFKNAVGYGLFSRSDEHVMKTRLNLFRRAGVFYTEDTATGKQTSLRTSDETRSEEHTS